MQLQISLSLRHVTLLRYRMIFYAVLFFTFLLRFVFVLTAVDTIDGGNKCSTIVCSGEKIKPKILGRNHEPNVPEVIYEILDQPLSNDELKGRSDIPQTLQEFMNDVKEGVYDAKEFAIKVREMVTFMEQRTRLAKIQKCLYHHVASNSIPKQLHCLELKLADEHANNAAARLQLPSTELLPALVDNNYFHFVLLSNNVLSASVVATSLIGNSLRPEKLVLHVITDKKSYYPMQAWFSLHPLSPAIIEVKTLKHFDWFRKGNKVLVMEAMKHDQKIQALRHKSLMNNIMIHLPQLFPSLNKVLFLDDDIVVQTDLTPLWDIDMNGKVNGAVETCNNGGDHNKLVMSKTKRFRNYLNFSHPLISNNFNPNQCAWAYGMNIFDLEAWRKTNISFTYHYWIEQNIKSDLSLWKLKTSLPPTLIAFHGYVHIIDPFWHMLIVLGYNEHTSFDDAKNAGVIHFNGRAKPWLDVAFPPQLRSLWTNHIDFSDKLVKSCYIREPRLFIFN